MNPTHCIKKIRNFARDEPAVGNDSLQVVREMARTGRTVLALAEPDYSQLADEPAALKSLGKRQIESLR